MCETAKAMTKEEKNELIKKIVTSYNMGNPPGSLNPIECLILDLETEILSNNIKKAVVKTLDRLTSTDISPEFIKYMIGDVTAQCLLHWCDSQNDKDNTLTINHIKLNFDQVREQTKKLKEE